MEIYRNQVRPGMLYKRVFRLACTISSHQSHLVIGGKRPFSTPRPPHSSRVHSESFPAGTVAYSRPRIGTLKRRSVREHFSNDAKSPRHLLRTGFVMVSSLVSANFGKPILG